MKFGLIIFLTVLAQMAGAQSLPSTINCRGYRPSTSEFKLSAANPKPETIGGVGFPANQQLLFRGVNENNPSLDLKIALRGLMNENNWFLSSPMMWGLTQVLTAQWDLDHDFIPNGGLPLTMREYFEARGILGDVETLQKCRPNGYTISEAETLASNLLNKMFANVGLKKLENRYLDISNPEYYRHTMTEKGFGNKGVEFITGSTYDQVASIYGKKILVFKDTRDRGVDLSFWNYKHNNKWWDSWVDSGEINIPVSIRANEVVGYQVRQNDRIYSGWSDTQPNNPIDVAFYRVEIGGETLVLILDGGDQLCMLHGQDRKLYSCSDRKWDKIMETALIPRPSTLKEDFKHQISLMGVISTCEKKCPNVDKTFAWYGKISDKALSSDMEDEIKRLQINGKSLHIHTRPVPASQKAANQKKTDDDDNSSSSSSSSSKTEESTIEVVSASYSTAAELKKGTPVDVLSKVAEYANGKTQVDYKVRYWHLDLEKSADAREFRVEWKCSLDKKKQRYKKTIAAPAEGKQFSIECPN